MQSEAGAHGSLGHAQGGTGGQARSAGATNPQAEKGRHSQRIEPPVKLAPSLQPSRHIGDRMPRGIPSYKSGLGYGQEIDNQIPLKFSTFHIPAIIPFTSKFSSSSYVRSEQQSIFSRVEPTAGKRKREDEDDFRDDTPPPTGPRGSNVIVIHPGTRYTRVGLASSMTPVTIPSVVARRAEDAMKGRHPTGTHLAHEYERTKRIERCKKLKAEGLIDPNVNPANPFDSQVILNEDKDKLNNLPHLRKMMKQRFEHLKLRWNSEANAIVYTFNSQVLPEPVEENYENHKPKWTFPKPEENYIVGQRALDLPDPAAAGYELHWPFYGTVFNYRDYGETSMLLNDIETLWKDAILQALQIRPRSYKHYSVMLVIPDWYEYHQMKELTDILLHNMGFDAVCIQQESSCATYGSGLANACVVDLGARKISVACVEDGLLMTDTRMVLNYGGDDISLMLNTMLERVHFPFVKLDPGLPWGWKILEELKHNLCTLDENALAINTFDVVVRPPNAKAQRYKFRLYDEVMIPPMILFEPRTLEFDETVWDTSKLFNPDLEDLGDLPTIHPTSAMVGSTAHLQAQIAQHERNEDERQKQHILRHQALLEGNAAQHMQIDEQAPPGDARTSAQNSPQPTPNPQTPGSGTSRFNLTPTQVATNLVWRPPVLAGTGTDAPVTNGTSSIKSPTDQERQPPGLNATIKIPQSQPPPIPIPQPQPLLAGTSQSSPAPPVPSQRTNGVHIVSQTPGSGASTLPQFQRVAAPTWDIPFEASKIPLDIAVFNSTRAASHVEKSKKFLQSVLLVGGVSHTQSIISQLESRLASLVARYLPTADNIKPQVITPKDVDPRIVVWKGAALFAKLESASDLWIKSTEWELLGTRAFKERTLFI